jgi:hypothetical protein
VLTTQATSQIRENVVTDITDPNANVPIPGTATRRVISPEAALLFNKSVVAKPLAIPEVSSIRIKSTEYKYRWVFLGQSGQMYTKRKAQGFTNATTDDVEALGGNVTADKGEIRAGDLILMKIRADIYDAAIKYNMEKAFTLQRARGMYLKGASSDVMSDSTPVRASVNSEAFSRTGKASNFIPEDPEALMNASASMGGLELARKQTEELREKVQKSKAAGKVAEE